MNAGEVLPMRELAQRLSEAEATIKALLSGQIDAVVDSRTSTPVLLSKAQAALRESEARYRASEEQMRLLLDSTGEGIYGVDLQGNCTFVNAACLRMLAYGNESELLGKSMHKMIHHTREGGTPHPVEQCRVFATGTREEEAVLDDEILWRADGSHFPAELRSFPLRREGACVGTVVSFSDITARKKAEQVSRQAFELKMQNRRIQQASRLKSEFLANMSHELRTPLNAIIGFGELLYDGVVPPDSPMQREFLGDILKGGRHLLQLINDVLDLAKVEAGKMDFRPEPVDLELIISEVMSIVSGTSVAKNIRMDASVAPALKEGIFLDPARLKQILYNFLSNALKFTHAGGAVTVRARPHGEDSLLLEVEDTGPGIAEEDIERLFVEFQQLEAGTAKEHSGTGLGLALTRRLAVAQGGSVGVRSTRGKGSVFHVILPRRFAATPAQPRLQTAAAHPELREA